MHQDKDEKSHLLPVHAAGLKLKEVKIKFSNGGHG